jgi:hypothetical protein
MSAPSTFILRILAALAITASLLGCAHRPPRVDCGSHLTPINMPTPKAPQPQGVKSSPESPGHVPP